MNFESGRYLQNLKERPKFIFTVFESLSFLTALGCANKKRLSRLEDFGRKGDGGTG